MLHDLQKSFADVALTNSVEALLPHVATPRGAIERRLGVYHANTLNSLIDVLSAAYPVIQRIVGDRFFQALAKDFIKTHPPQQPTLFRYGDALPDFISSFAPANDLPYLPDVARLEWTRVEAYFAADSAALNPERLAEVPAEQIADIKFSVSPTLRLLESDVPIFTLWHVNQPDQDRVPEIDFSHPESGFVLRPAHTVMQRVVPMETLIWLRALTSGETLGTATELALTHENTFDLQNTLRQHLVDGTFTELYL